jgi:RNA polymerase sigma factor (sigma-70 family)
MNLEELVKQYQPYLYNLALRLVYYPQDAKDLSSDVWIKIFENIDKFEKKSDFKTWSYRIMINEFLNQRRKYTELTFDDFEDTMNSLRDEELSHNYDEPEKALLIHEAKVGCMMGMLLCLDAKQRAVFIIGDIFEIKSNIACEIFGISKENFRKQLSRARSDLYSFMNNHCSLIHTKNQCKCEQKTKALIEKGYVDPNNLLFTTKTQKRFKEKMELKSEDLCNTMEEMYKKLYQQHPFLEIDEEKFAKTILASDSIKSIFEL